MSEISSNKTVIFRIHPALIGFAAGFAPLVYLYDRNFNLVNSIPQFTYFVLLFFIIPMLLMVIMSTLTKSFSKQDIRLKLFSILNFILFTSFVVFVTYGLNKKKILLLSLLIAVVLGYLFHKQLKKVVGIQIILGVFSLIGLMPTIFDYVSYSDSWLEQQDNIADVVFKKRPNIYFLQPDGYVDFKVLNDSPYNHNSDGIQRFLKGNNFKIYDGFRGNYTSTLTSNSSMFAMKQHYFHNETNVNEFYKARDLIVGKNPVVEVFKKNNYNTNLILDVPYLLVNRPEVAFDHCNFELSELPLLSRGFEITKDTTADLLEAMDSQQSDPQFYFVRFPNPGHVATRASYSKGKDEERLIYLKKLESANVWLTDIVQKIKERDPNSMIIIASDHGGYVGFDYSRQRFKNTATEESLVRSIYSSILAVKWPDDSYHEFENELRSPVNLFRILFAYLSEDPTYLDQLEPDSSFGIITLGAPEGIYERINEKGEVVFNKISE